MSLWLFLESVSLEYYAKITEHLYQGLDTGWNIHFPEPTIGLSAPSSVLPTTPSSLGVASGALGASLCMSVTLLFCGTSIKGNEQVTSWILALTYEESRHQPSLAWPKQDLGSILWSPKRMGSSAEANGSQSSLYDKTSAKVLFLYQKKNWKEGHIATLNY